jgi:hypothetical protein
MALWRSFDPVESAWQRAGTALVVERRLYCGLFGLVHALMPGHGKTALIGAIWQVKDNLSFDVGFRHAIVNGAGVNEVRAGLTYGFPL